MTLKSIDPTPTKEELQTECFSAKESPSGEINLKAEQLRSPEALVFKSIEYQIAVYKNVLMRTNYMFPAYPREKGRLFLLLFWYRLNILEYLQSSCVTTNENHHLAPKYRFVGTVNNNKYHDLQLGNNNINDRRSGTGSTQPREDNWVAT